jgi:hypothetical protein
METLACTNCGAGVAIPPKPARPDGPVTKPSSPRAIRLADLAKAIEDMEKTREECVGPAECPICGKTEPHHHDA